MRTSTLTVTIVCPDWCTVDPQGHADELGELGGLCIHQSENDVVPDPVGFWAPMEEPRLDSPTSVWVSSSTRPDGTPAESSVVFVDGRNYNPEHARDLAVAILRAIELPGIIQGLPERATTVSGKA